MAISGCRTSHSRWRGQTVRPAAVIGVHPRDLLAARLLQPEVQGGRDAARFGLTDQAHPAVRPVPHALHAVVRGGVVNDQAFPVARGLALEAAQGLCHMRRRVAHRHEQ